MAALGLLLVETTFVNAELHTRTVSTTSNRMPQEWHRNCLLKSGLLVDRYSALPGMRRV